MGWGYDEGKLAEGHAPTRYDLDKGCSDSPVMVKRTCGHICAVNSKALEMAGVTAATPDPEGGRIGRDENGEPNGILYENGRNVLNDILPDKTVEDMAGDLAALSDILVSQGVTTGADMGEFTDSDYNSIFGRAIQKGMKVKVAAYYMWDGVKDEKDFTITKDEQDPARQFRIAGIKLIGDGSVSGRTAWCDKPYLGGNASTAYLYAQMKILKMPWLSAKNTNVSFFLSMPWVQGPSTGQLHIHGSRNLG